MISGLFPCGVSMMIRVSAANVDISHKIMMYFFSISGFIFITVGKAEVFQACADMGGIVCDRSVQFLRGYALQF